MTSDGSTHPRPVRAPGPRPDVQKVAAERLGAHRRRMTTMRKRVIATALVVFALVWAVLFVQLVTGHDPALSKQTAAASTGSGATSSGSSTTGSSSTGSSSSGSSGTGSSSTGSSGSSSTSGATTPLTTSQS